MLRRSWFVLLLAIAVPAQTPEAPPAAPPAPPAPPAQPPLTITGRAVTWDGEPIAGARFAPVTIAGPTTDELLRGEGPVTAADGAFTLEVAPRPDAAKLDQPWLALAKKGFAARLVWLPTDRPSPATGKPLALGDVVLAAGHRMVGRVRDTAGQPVAGARVIATDLLPELLHGGETHQWWCGARSNAAGIFDLPCALPSGSVLRVEADGYFVATRRPVAAGAPLEIELQPSGWLAGRVVREGDVGIADASVYVQYETVDEAQPVVADATGAFRAPRQHPGRWRVHATPPGDVRGERGRSGVGDGARDDVRVVVPAAAAEPAPRKLAVRAVTKGTGAAVRSLRAVAAWGEEATQPWMRQHLLAQLRATKPSGDGTVELDAPADEGARGLLLVRAEGHVPLLQNDLAWSESTPSVAVELEPEASVRGVVRDAATGQPIAGAAVVLFATGEEAELPWAARIDELTPRTAADGSFRVGELGAGEWELRVRAPQRPPVPGQSLTLTAGEARGGIVVDVPAGATVAGKLVGGAFARGTRVLLAPIPTGAERGEMVELFAYDDVGPWSTPQPPSQPVGADGAFAFAGQALGHYTMLLELPALPRTGGPLQLPIESFRLRAGGWQKDLDVAADRAWRIAGRVTFPGAAVPFENLVVLATPGDGGGMPFHAYYGAGIGTRAFVGRDGTFALPVVDGRYRCVVFDLALGIEVAFSKAIEVRGADATCELAVPLVAIELALQPADGERMALVSHAHVHVVRPGVAGAFGGVMVDDFGPGPGMPVPVGATTLSLVVPHGDVTIALRNRAGQLGDEHQHDAAPLGKVELQVPGGVRGPITVDVAPPPEITAEATGAGDGKR